MSHQQWGDFGGSWSIQWACSLHVSKSRAGLVHVLKWAKIFPGTFYSGIKGMEFLILPPTLRAFLLISSERHGFMAKYQYLKTNALASWQQTCLDLSHTGKKMFDLLALCSRKLKIVGLFFYSFEKTNPEHQTYLLHSTVWGHETSDLRKSCDTSGRTCLVFCVNLFFFLCVWMASCLCQNLWSLEAISPHWTIPKCFFSRAAVHVILVVTGVTVSLSVRNCPSIFCLSVSLITEWWLLQKPNNIYLLSTGSSPPATIVITTAAGGGQRTFLLSDGGEEVSVERWVNKLALTFRVSNCVCGASV